MVKLLAHAGYILVHQVYGFAQRVGRLAELLDGLIQLPDVDFIHCSVLPFLWALELAQANALVLLPILARLFLLFAQPFSLLLFFLLLLRHELVHKLSVVCTIIHVECRLCHFLLRRFKVVLLVVITCSFCNDRRRGTCAHSWLINHSLDFGRNLRGFSTSGPRSVRFWTHHACTKVVVTLLRGVHCAIAIWATHTSISRFCLSLCLLQRGNLLWRWAFLRDSSRSSCRPLCSQLFLLSFLAKLLLLSSFFLSSFPLLFLLPCLFLPPCIFLPSRILLLSPSFFSPLCFLRPPCLLSLPGPEALLLSSCSSPIVRWWRWCGFLFFGLFGLLGFWVSCRLGGSSAVIGWGRWSSATFLLFGFLSLFGLRICC
mmetsp:Transcript_100/g.278  ORF Transcript_100/g.278 Transcript_100/m.278 type:complete len:371 (+) Transcript_100:295-1407(+)